MGFVHCFFAGYSLTLGFAPCWGECLFFVCAKKRHQNKAHPTARPAARVPCASRPGPRDWAVLTRCHSKSPLVPPMRTRFRGKRPLACLSGAERREFKGPRRIRAQQGSRRAAPTGIGGVVSIASFSCRHKKRKSPSKGRNQRPEFTAPMSSA